MKTDLGTWKQLCPYGIWTCARGRQVLFNRSYCPILERQGTGPAKAANPNEWVRYRKQEHLFTDWDAPWHSETPTSLETLERVNALLGSWGLPSLSKPPPRPKVQWDKVVLIDPFAGGLPEPREENPWIDIIAQQTQQIDAVIGYPKTR